MIKLYPNEKFQLPPKRLLGNNFDPEFIEGRRSALHAYIQKILMNPMMRNRCVHVPHRRRAQRRSSAAPPTPSLCPPRVGAAACSEPVKEFLLNGSQGKVASVVSLIESVGNNGSRDTLTQGGNGSSTNGTETSDDKTKASLEDFFLLKVIGKGSFGKVFLARHIASDKLYAVKVLNKDLIIRQVCVCMSVCVCV